ncbi:MULTISPECIES: transporter substrate-binding domain-containing protein [unclassified Pseudomonas]|uniref:substrate-binding periplasmic protein n=1 Tax=unclassified Pseudomonas TaxID=196821 RepID=UPI002448632F|nr:MULTISPECIES: transporter substrate-binding domain-containing protein [unclassified Pseudomonas]MDH0894072.1 transporter substrate-binding domain-containing protein [Pseudomonas sp. GD03875]MDH1062827.1 transporter substrate-binding domain-containing protein [Pseudomonas sp. GD03985]
MPLWRLPWLLPLLLIAYPCLAADEVVRYPRAMAGGDFRPAYPLAQLQLALDKTGSPLRIVPSDYAMEQDRALLSLEQDKVVDVVWTMTSRERERRLLPVRIPLDRGLYGWRIALVRDDSRQMLADVHDLAGLSHWRAGQGHDWPDTGILRSHGLKVETSSSYASLFRMLRAGRFDYFPRAVLEARGELQHTTAQGLVLDEHLALRYPAAMYFFFSPHNPQLAETVRQGLEAALADGSFEQLFQQYHSADLRDAGMERRRVIELNNPLLPAETPLQRSELWYRP